MEVIEGGEALNAVPCGKDKKRNVDNFGLVCTMQLL